MFLADAMSNRWFFRQHTKDGPVPQPTNWNSCGPREKGIPSPPRIQLTACSPTAGRVPPLAPQGIPGPAQDHSRSLEPPVLQLSTGDSLDNIAQHIPSVRVEFYVNENTLKERLQLFFIKNQRSSLRIRIFNLVLKLLSCLMYVVRVMLDRGPEYAVCFNCPIPTNYTMAKIYDEAEVDRPPQHINWNAVLWVDRPLPLWGIQVSLSIISLSEALLIAYLGYKGNVWQTLLHFTFVLELVNNVPFVMTVCWTPLRNIFVPGFLNCWLAKHALENMFNDLHRAMQRSQSALSQRLMILSATLLCLIFTSVCGFQHFQRSGNHNVDLFKSLYFVVVTFSTVGYGDYRPDVWPSQLFMVVMICVALIVLPTQFEQLAYTWMERQKLGGTYSMHRARSERHVVVCSTTLRADTVMDLLNEFYAHPLLQDYYVVLLSPCELDATMKMILQVPMWAQRVIYIQGSALKDTDLTRARMNAAEACFILAARNYADRSAADEHTILRSWAVRDFAPNVPQYVQIFRPENKVHVAFAEHVVCEDEFKYALLANNCLCPGTSTLVTLLLHTSRGQEGEESSEEWQRLYGKCSGNEIYHIRLGDSRFFGEYEGKSFTYASFHSHRKYGVSLVGVQTDVPGTWPIMLNPGPSYHMQASDICFYMNITKEENSAFMPAHEDAADPPSAASLLQLAASNERRKSDYEMSPLRTRFKMGLMRKLGRHLDVPGRPNDGGLPSDSTALVRGRRPSIAPVPAMFGPESSSESDSSNAEEEHQGEEQEHQEDHQKEDDEEKYLEIQWVTPAENCEIVKGFPPVSPYVGVSPTLCYLLKKKKPLCCLQLAQVCVHCSFRNAREYNWPSRCIILAADFASNGIYNFIVPLRAHFHLPQTLRPIILLLEKRPHEAFLDAMSWFPLVYWMQGSIDNLDNLLRAGINLADSVVVVNKETTNSAEEDFLADCNTIVAVQTMFKMFPSVRIITELSQSSNMRFMQFRANDIYALHLSKMEKSERERGSHISYMFRLPFAAGSVFSASMLDTLLYQAFVKEYMITFVRLLLGIDQAPGSGFLSSMRITKEDSWIRTYGRLYQKLCSSTCEIPIGIYRTQSAGPAEDNTVSLVLADSERNRITSELERQEISKLVKNRMVDLRLPTEDYDDVSEKRSGLSYVIINPSCNLKLEVGDVIFLIRPSPISSLKIFMKRGSIRASKKRQRNSPQEDSSQSPPGNAHILQKKLSVDVEVTPPSEAGKGTIV